jgi:hypothetical protein
MDMHAAILKNYIQTHDSPVRHYVKFLDLFPRKLARNMIRNLVGNLEKV